MSRPLTPQARDRLPDSGLSRRGGVARPERAGHNLSGVSHTEMQVVCAQCHAVVVVEDVVSASQGSQAPCARCGAPIDLQSAVPESGERAWLVQTDAGCAGPYTAQDLALVFDRGSADWSSAVWRAGLKDWRAARRDPELVTALASVRGGGGSWDTQRVAEHTSLLPEPQAAVPARPAPELAHASAAVRTDSAREVRPVAAPRAPQRVAPGLGPREVPSVERPRAAPLSESQRAAREALADASRTAHLSEAQPAAREVLADASPGSQAEFAAPTFADALRSAPSVLAALPTLEPARAGAGARRLAAQSWLPSARSMVLVAIVAFGSGVLAAALWGQVLERRPARASTLLVPTGPRARELFAQPAAVTSPLRTEVSAAPAASAAQAGVEASAAAALAASTVEAAPSSQASPAADTQQIATALQAAPSSQASSAADTQQIATALQAAPSSQASSAAEIPAPAELMREFKRISPEVRRCVGMRARAVDVEVFLEGASGQVAGINLHASRLTPGEVECITHALRELQVAPFRSAEHKLTHRFVF